MIRAANACDICQIAEIEKESFSDGWSSEGLAAALDDSIGIFLVSEEQDMIAGYIIGSCDGENGYIEKLAVHLCRRRNGIALKLLEEFAAQLPPCADISLEVRESNQAAIAVYSRFGFEQAGIRKRFYSSPAENAVVMIRKGR